MMKRNKSNMKIADEKKPSKKITRLRLHFIPNSHLDREWGMDFQQTRKLTVDFIDTLLEIFRKIPEYTFLLDSQTVPLEDYLEIKPEKRDEIIQRVKEKRLFIGPWYTAPDFLTISGESAIRNLLIGHKVAKNFGGVMKIGYTPFGFGQVSQLPQIYQGFGIDTALFYRGITKNESPSSEFVWESPDGTQVFGCRFGSAARYNFYFFVWRPVLFKGKTLLERISDWTEGGLPFKSVDKEGRYENYFMPEAKTFFDRNSVLPYLKKLIEREKEHYSTHIIAMMQGMDTSAPDIREAEIIKIAQEGLGEEVHIFFSSLPAFVNELKRFIKKQNINLKIFKGEMRYPESPSTYFTSSNSDVVSARIPQKQLAKKAETYLQRWAEPFATIAYLLGEKYPSEYLEVAWKYLLKCHAHDTVGGCGIDDMQSDAEYRLRQVLNISKFIRRDSLLTIQKYISNGNFGKNEIIITVFNPLPYERSEVVQSFVDVPDNLKIVHLRMFDSNGKEVSIFEGNRRHTEKVVRTYGDAANAYVGEEIDLRFFAENVPAFGYKTYVVRGGEHAPLLYPTIATSPNSMENDFLEVSINNDGSLNLFDKQTKTVYSNIHIFEDGGDAGEAWTYRPPSQDQIILSTGSPAEIKLIENSHLSATIKVSTTMQIPAGMGSDSDHHLTWRLEEQKPLRIESLITLKKNSPLLEFETHIENNSKNHRLRALFPTKLNTDKSYAEQPFDVVSRTITRGENHPFRFALNPPLPFLRFVDLSDGEKGFSIITKGLHEYEAKDDKNRTLALTLLRAFEVTLCTVSYRWERLPEMNLNQCLGHHILHYAIYPHTGNWESGNVLQWTESFHLPLLPTQTTPHNGIKLPQEKSFINISPPSVAICAFKKSENKKSLIARLFNPTEQKQDVKVTINFPFKGVQLVSFNEIPLEKSSTLKVKNNTIYFEIPKKKIITLMIKL